MHLSISDNNCQVWGGHLENGSIVLKGADILIGSFSNDNSALFIDDKSLASSSKPRLEIATLPNCPWSARIKRTLEYNKIAYKNITVKDDTVFHKIKGLSGSSIFPQVFLDGQYIGGYTEFLSLYSSGKLLSH